MANDAQMPERIWATPEEAELLQPEDGFNPADQGMTEYVRSDLCASGQVRALEWHDCTDGTSHDHDCQYEIEREGRLWRVIRASTGPSGYLCHSSSPEAAKAAAQVDYERRILAALTPAPQVDAEHCGCGDKACLACFPAATPTAQEAEPVAWALFDVEGVVCAITTKIADHDAANWTPLYAHPPQPIVSAAEVLKPFANMINHIETDTPDDYHPSWAEFLTVGDFRRAAAALRALKGGEA